MWPIVIGLISAVYCTLSLRLLILRQAQFKEFISCGSGLTSSRYFRLMALAMTDIVLTIPFGIYELYSNAAGGDLEPWQGWANTHFDFSRVVQYPAVVWMYDPKLAVPLQLSRWIIPLCAFIFFAYFGFAEEARKRYRAVYLAIVNRLPIRRSSSPRDPMTNQKDSPKGRSSTMSRGTLPLYTLHPPSLFQLDPVPSAVVKDDNGDFSPSDTCFTEKSSCTGFVNDLVTDEKC
ncbi:hypothetical protein AcW1_002111 [Taiwanofungus camphoratus]|nr:hypothetical protein AcW1_002111 [Antrodia cinnamomea]